MSQENETINLFAQTKDLVFMGERLSGDPEVLHEVQDWAGLPVNRPQIQKVLEYVPKVFPEDWVSPDGFDELGEEQQRAFMEVLRLGIVQITGQYIQTIIRLGISFRDNHQ